ncbi:MAG: hypothetical protein LBP20_10870 [Treponema sp.]|jgi:hypothetical protein|nr:hypothetical protein [Treponema sp.]
MNPLPRFSVKAAFPVAGLAGKLLLPLFSLALFHPAAVFPQPGAGVSAAAAEQYVVWAEQAIGEGRWDDALAALERGADFASVSSDVSYLLAEVRCHKNLPLRPALDSLYQAFDTARWERYVPSRGRLLEAEILICLRDYSGALRALDLAERDPSIEFDTGQDILRGGTAEAPKTGRQYALVLRLLALKGLPEAGEFLRVLGLVMDRYPRDPRPPEILFSWAAGRMPEDGNSSAWPDRSLVDLALRRLPLFLEGQGAEAPEPPLPGSQLRGISGNSRLGCLAASFIRDTGEARRLVSACRALGKTGKEALPISLDLGIIDDLRAVEELFEFAADPAARILDKDTILRVWTLARSSEGRDLIRRNLLSFSGTIITDADRDGLREEWVRYSSGTALEYCRDADQDGQEDMRVGFSAGTPLWALEGGGIRVEWERYPAVLQAELDGVLYVPAPETMFYAPIRFSPLTGSAQIPGAGPAPLCPEADPRHSRLTERTLVSFALKVVRPSVEFPGGLEYIEMDQGIPRRAVEVFEGKTVSLTEFVLGQPRIQRLDLDMDGRMETIRRFREGTRSEENPLAYEKILESVETDKDRDGLYETAEYFYPDGTSVYSWDATGDGVRDYSETRRDSAR